MTKNEIYHLLINLCPRISQMAKQKNTTQRINDRRQYSNLNREGTDYKKKFWVED